MRAVKKLEDVFPVWKIESVGGTNNTVGTGACILDKLGCITVGFVLQLPEIFTLSSSDYTNMHGSWVRAIKTCMPGTILHKQDWFMQATYSADFEKENSFLLHHSERHFNERRWLNHESYLFITFVPSQKFTANALSSSLTRSSFVPTQSQDKKLVAEFLDRVGQFVKVLSDSGMISVRQLGADELSSTATKAGLIERYCYLQSEDDPRMVCDIEMGSELNVGDKAVSVFSLSGIEELPAACGPRITYEKYSKDGA